MVRCQQSKKPTNSFVVRVSDKHTGYAITVSYEQNGVIRYSHIMVMMHDNPKGPPLWLVSDKQFHSLTEVIRFYQTNSYKDLFTLGNAARSPSVPNRAAGASAQGGGGGGGGGPPPVPVRTLPKGAKMDPNHDMDAYASIDESPYSSIEDPNHGSFIYSIAGDSVQSLTGEAAAKGRVSLANEGDEDEDAYMVPGVLRAGAETVDFASEDIYLDIGAATKITQAPKRSSNPREWGAPEVLQFLSDNGLDAFKPVLYRNGVVGTTLMKLRATMFPAGKFSDEELEKFDHELMRLRLSGM